MNIEKLFTLQLFAVQTTLLDTTGNDLSPEMKTYYEKDLLENAKPNLVYNQFGQKKPIPANNGKSVEWRKFTKLAKATTPLTEGVTPSGNILDVTIVTGNVDQYGDYIAMSDVLELTSIDNVVLQTNKILADQASETLDTITRDVIMAGTNVLYADKVTSGTVTAITSRADLTADCKLTPDVIWQARRALQTQNIKPIDGKYYVCIIHPDVAYDLQRNAEWIDAHKYDQPENLYNGEIGQIGGVRFVLSSEAKIFKDSTTTPSSGLAVYGCLMLGENAYGVTGIDGGGLEFILKQKGSAGTADPLNQRSSVGWKSIHGAVILADEAMIRIECCGKYSATAAAN